MVIPDPRDLILEITLRHIMLVAILTYPMKGSPRNLWRIREVRSKFEGWYKQYNFTRSFGLIQRNKRIDNISFHTNIKLSGVPKSDPERLNFSII